MSDKLTIANAEKRYIPCEVYSRVVGYLRPVAAWNEGKRQEFEDRVEFNVPRQSGSTVVEA